MFSYFLYVAIYLKPNGKYLIWTLTCTNNPLNAKKSKCQMTCGDGTVLEGSDKLKCVEGASGWDWDGTWPICKEGKSNK